MKQRDQEHRHTYDHGAAAPTGLGKHICTICGKVRLKTWLGSRVNGRWRALIITDGQADDPITRGTGNGFDREVRRNNPAGPRVYNRWMTKASDFTLLDQGGQPWTLSDQRGHAVVLLFLRGDWWPYCNGQLVSVALRHSEFTGAGAIVVAIDVDSPGQHVAMIGKLNLSFPMLSDPDRSLSIEPFDLMNEVDPRGLAIPATVLIDPDGDEVMRLVSRDFADRPLEGVVLDALQRLDLDSVTQPPLTPGKPEPGPRAMPFRDLRAYFRGAKFGSKAMGMRTGATDEADGFASLMDHYIDDVATMYRIIRESQ